MKRSRGLRRRVEGEVKADLQQDVKNAREAAQSEGEALRKSADDSKGKTSAWWDSVQRSWNDHLAAVRENIDEKRSEHDLKAAQRTADSAEQDAAFAIDYAYAATPVVAMLGATTAT